MNKKTKPIIAIDGCSSSGKATIAKKIANYFSFRMLDTGLLYRAFAKILNQNKELSSFELIDRNVNIKSHLNDKDLQSEEIAKLSSIISKDKLVRDFLLKSQQDVAYSPGDEFEGAVLEGRDIGTVVCPDADCKIFITASVEERARRKIISLDEIYSFEEVIQMLKDRDNLDMNREISPLKYDSSYYVIDTTDMTVCESFSKIKDYIIKKLSGKYKLSKLEN